MVHLLIEISRFTMIIWFAIYAYDCFAALRSGVSEKAAKRRYHRQTSFMYLIVLNGFLVLYLATEEKNYLYFCAMVLVVLTICVLVFKKIYSHGSTSLANNMCMLLAVGLLILARLDLDKAYRQLFFVVAGVLVTALVPLLIRKMTFLPKLSVFYAAVGILGLLLVLVTGSTVYGAKLNITIGSFTVQPSEFVKILFVFFVASMFAASTELKQLLITTAVALLHVLILAASRDLGSAGIFLITYLIMIYVATGRLSYLLGGIGFGALALVLSYFLFSHVKTRVIAWLDPLSVIDSAGYQVSQSLFAIGTGGWFGSGLTLGSPSKIPVVESDFVFSAISEELGGVFALCLIFVCICCFLMFFNIAMQLKDPFYKMVALGLGTVYASQVFITIGGVTKFIPSTGVTLPLVSYGGSSLISTMFLFAVIQGLYEINQGGGREDVS